MERRGTLTCNHEREGMKKLDRQRVAASDVCRIVFDGILFMRSEVLLVGCLLFF